MISYSKASSILIFVSSMSAQSVNAHSIPEDFDVEKYQAQLKEVRFNSSVGSDFMDGHEFVPPGPDDQRSPCPFINTMANHKFIPHSGKDVPALDIPKLALYMYDLPEEGFKGIVNAAIYAGQAIVQEDGDILLDLDRLWDRPGEERDASMVFPNPGTAWPKDLFTPGAVPLNTNQHTDVTFQKFRRTVNEDMLESMLSKNPGSDVLTIDNMYSYFYDRIVDSRRDDPFFRWGEISRAVACGQYHLPTLILGESADNFSEAPKEYIKAMLMEDRLPDGYTPRSVRYPDFDGAKYIAALQSQSVELFKTAFMAEAVDLTEGPGDSPNLRGRVELDVRVS